MNLTLTAEQAQRIIRNRVAMIDDDLLRQNCELDLMYTELDQVEDVPLTPYDLDKYFINRVAYLSRATYIQKVLEMQLGPDRAVDYVESYSPSGNPVDDFEIWSAMIIDQHGNTDRERKIFVRIEIGDEIK